MRIIILLIASSFSFGVHQSFAQCSCLPKLTLREHFQRAAVVFFGKVIEVKKLPGEKTDIQNVVIKFEVKQAWKQDSARFVVVTEFYGSTEGFERDAVWLLYALKNADGTLRIERGCCSRTKQLSVGAEDIKVFKKMGQKPKNIIEGQGEAEQALESDSP